MRLITHNTHTLCTHAQIGPTYTLIHILSCIYAYKYVNTHVAHTRTNQTYIHTCLYKYSYIYICTHTCRHAYMHTFIHAYMHTCILAYIHTCIHTIYIHIYIHTYINTCMHAYIHTNTSQTSSVSTFLYTHTDITAGAQKLWRFISSGTFTVKY